MAFGDHGLGVDGENGLRNGLQPDRSGGQRLAKKEPARVGG